MRLITLMMRAWPDRYMLALRLGLRQPERHAHLAQHTDRRRQLGAGLIQAPDTAVQLAQAEMAVGLERAGSIPSAVASACRSTPRQD